MNDPILLVPRISENPTPLEYAWFQLPYAIPGTITFVIGLFLAYISFLSLFHKPKSERNFFIHLILGFLGNGFLGLVLAFRAVVLDKEVLLWLNNYFYSFVMLLSPAIFYIIYKITEKKYKLLYIFTIICWITYFLGVFDVFRFHAFKNIWIEYSFGNYPKANLFVSLWGIIASIGCVFFVIPFSIQYAIQNRSKVNISVLLGLNLIFFLPVTNLPSILGYKFYPGANFSFVAMMIFAFGVFRSDFLDINDLLFNKKGLFYIITIFFTVLFIAIFLSIVTFLRPTAEENLYSKSYFLIPLLSGFCVFILAIYLAGSNPNEKINIMAASSLLVSGVFMVSLTSLALKLPLIVCHRIDQLSYLLFAFAPSLQLRFVLLIMNLKPSRYMVFVDIACIIMMFWSQTPYFFGQGLYDYSFGYIAQSGIGLSLFGVLGFISVSFMFYYYWKNRARKNLKITRLVVLSFGFGGILLLLNLPSTKGFDFYPFGTMQWIPASMIVYAVLKYGAVRVRGEAEAIGNRLSLLTLLGIAVFMTGYYLSFTDDIPFFIKIKHILLATCPLIISFYAFTFILTRPISQKLDDNYKALAKEKEIVEKLIHNILPTKVARELKEKGEVAPVYYESASVLFTDFKGFTKVAESMSVQELVKELDACFFQFDEITQRYHLEKIKTIGDSYMCAGGLPEKNNTHALDSCLAALEIQGLMNQIKEIKETLGIPYWELRLGIHTGPIIAGVVGKHKFAYDIWGDTVNTASRMESSGEAGMINISGYVYAKVKRYFECEYRGKIKAKNKGDIDMYFLYRLKKEYSKDENGRVPNDRFHEEYSYIANNKIDLVF